MSEKEESFQKMIWVPSTWIAHPGVGLFLASFLSLFLELLLIRWVSSVIRIVAYYGNLMLISSFLGLGCGILLSRRGLGLYKWFAPLLLLLVIFVLAARRIEFQQGSDELRFLFEFAGSTTTLPVVLVFILNALIFVPWGELIGGFFRRLPPLQAYSWDLGGAITGTVLFGIFSYFWFSPSLGFGIIMAAFLVYSRNNLQFCMTAISLTVILGALLFSADPTAIWSPYSLISVRKIESNGKQKPVSAPRKDITIMQDPPFYTVQVNQDFYMWSGTIDGRRYTDPVRHLIRPRSDKVVSLLDLRKRCHDSGTR